MKVIMTKTTKGSITGYIVEEFKKGNKYNLPEDLAKVFIKMKAAEIDKFAESKPEPKKVLKVETKMEKPNYENKIAKPKYSKKKSK